jgi:carbamoyl-phosphate synthase large subunit
MAILAELREATDRPQPIEWPIAPDKLRRKLKVPSQGRLYYIRYAFRLGWSIEQVHEATNIDPWFLDQLHQLVDFELTLLSHETLDALPPDVLARAKAMGYSDPQLANVYLGAINPDTILQVRAVRKQHRIEPVYKLVDTCAAEFEAATPYYYSTYESPITRVTAPPADRVESSSPVCYADEAPHLAAVRDDEIRVTDRKKIIILGGGPNRIGQGIEFDYCCVQAAFAADELGFESVMINSNPETVSTDYDTSDLLFFEPLTLEDVLNICERLNGGPLGRPGLLHGVIVQFGGQTPLNLAHGLEKAGVPIIGTSVDSIDLAESRERFSALITKLGIQQPDNGIAHNAEQAAAIASQIGYPVLVRPSFVLGGRAMETVYDEPQLRHYMAIALGASDLPDQPILIDNFLADAIECDVDVVADYASNGSADQCRAMVAGVMEHIEEAGIHSGDSACAIPPYSLPPHVVEQLKVHSRRLAEALNVRGLMNVQWAIRRPSNQSDGATSDYEIYVLEVNPRASRTVPFVSKATGISWARIAAKVMVGRQLDDLGVTEEVTPGHTSVKESVFPFSKFPGVDVILGPEMRSTGEVMGIDPDFAIAFAKSQMAAGTMLPTTGKVFITLREADKPAMVDVARQLTAMGLELVSTGGTGRYLQERGIRTTHVNKLSEGRPNALDLMKNHEIALIIITPTRKGIASDEGRLRAAAVRFNVPIITTVTAARAATRAIAALQRGDWSVKALQDYFPQAADLVNTDASLSS